MKYVWDLAKSEDTFRRHGLDFLFATLVFEGPILVRVDARKDYGEERRVAIGLVDGEYLTVVFTDRIETNGQLRRIISARRSNRRERSTYEKTCPSSEA